MIDEILIDALSKGASDIHITSNCKTYFRIKGRLLPQGDKTYTISEVEEMTKKILKNKYDNFIFDRQIDLAYTVEGFSRFRVNAYFQKGTISLTLRAIKSEPPTLEELKMPSVFKELIKLRNGLILITGATGSGKTTTLAALINEINRTKEDKVVTLEDPIEFIFENNKSLITQREIGNDVKTFADGLKAMLRQDPDVIVTGELRDIETIELALTAAETGHLVLATLHTNSAISTIERITSVFPAEQQEKVQLQLAKSLRAVISQYLVPTKSDSRVAALEILINTRGISNLIKENKLTQIPNMIKMGRSEGMITMNDALDQLIKNGIISEEISEIYKIK